MNKECIDCFSTAIEMDKGELITLISTVITGIFLRFVERRRDKKRRDKDISNV